MTRRGRKGAALGLCCLLAAAVADARAEPGSAEAAALGASDQPLPLTRMRLDLRAGLGARHDVATIAGTRSEADGRTLSDVVLAGAWFASRLPLGVAGRLEIDRFSLATSNGAAPASTSATALELMVAAAARLRPGSGSVVLEGQLGYGLLQEPLAPARTPARTFALSTLRAHGPVAAASATVHATDALQFEIAGRAFPATFGGQYADQALALRRFVGGALAGVQLTEAAGARFAAVVSYELALTTGDGNGAAIDQLHQQVALGLRVTSAAPRATSLAAPTPPVGARARLRGVVRAEAAAGEQGAPLEGVAVAVKGGPSTRTASDGSFAFDELTPGMIELALTRGDLIPGTEVVSLPAGGEATLPITLRPSAAAAPAVVRGLVRGGRGAPVAAQVRLVELDQLIETDAQGHFRFEIPAGRYTLTIDAAGFASQRKSVVARAGEHNIYNVDLQEQR